MRELVFALEYEPGANRVADALVGHPDARIRSLSLHATADHLWRVDHATGPSDALDDVADAVLGSDYYADCLATEACCARQTTRVLDRTDDALVLYSHWERNPVCSSIPHLALDTLGAGVLFETRHEGRHQTWRLLHAGDGDEAAFFDALGEEVGEAAHVETLRVTTTTTDPSHGGDSALSPEQEAALRAAVEHGYYESPRDVDVATLADHLDVPRSTLTYRLRRAEEQLAKTYVGTSKTEAPPTAD